jgi:hypothetical protein
MNHEFIVKEIPPYIDFLKFDECKFCINCKIYFCKKDYVTEYFAYFFIEDKEIFEDANISDSQKLLDLTCEELIIKLLLE